MRTTRSTGCQPVICLSNQAGKLYHVAGFALPIASLLIFQSFLVLWIGKKNPDPRFYLIAKVRFHGKVNR